MALSDGFGDLNLSLRFPHGGHGSFLNCLKLTR